MVQPPPSPDLSVIQLMWDYMRRKKKVSPSDSTGGRHEAHKSSNSTQK